MATMNISLPDPMRDYVQKRIDSGQYASVSDYVRDLIRRDQERADKIAAMQRLIDEAEESGASAKGVQQIFDEAMASWKHWNFWRNSRGRHAHAPNCGAMSARTHTVHI